MKRILNLIIVLILVVVAVKLFIWLLIPLAVLIAGVVIYSKYKMKKMVKQFEEEQRQTVHFTQSEPKEDVKAEVDKEDHFNGTVIDVDFEDVKRD